MKIDDFLPYIMVEVPGCPYPLATQTLMNVASDFCQQTLVWNDYSDPITLIDGQRDYDLDYPIGAKPFATMAVMIGSRKLRPVTMTELQLVLPNWPAATSSDPAYYNSAFDRDLLSVFPTPLGAVQPMIVRLSYSPNRKATTLPDLLGDEFLTAITSGVKARLMAMQGTPWFNAQMSVYYKTIYDEGVFTARTAEMHERVPGNVLVPPRAFGF